MKIKKKYVYIFFILSMYSRLIKSYLWIHVLVLSANQKSSLPRFCVLCESGRAADATRGCGDRGLYWIFYLYLWPSHNAAASACPRSVLLFYSFHFQVGLIHLQRYSIGLKASTTVTAKMPLSIGKCKCYKFNLKPKLWHMLNSTSHCWVFWK